MRMRLANLWDSLSTSFWFVPALMIIIAIGLSVATVELDVLVKGRIVRETEWIWVGGPDGARGLLSTIAGSMITVAGVVFSITIVSLTLASSQFGPRLMRNFIHNKSNQLVLGTFTATFVYCLLVLWTVRGNGENWFVPHVSITVGLAFAMASIGVLIYFIHHVSMMIQAPHIIALVARDLDESIERMFPERLGQGEPAQHYHNPDQDLPADFDSQACPVTATGSGYLQAIDTDRLMGIATKQGLLICLRHRPGAFIVQDDELMTVRPRERVTKQLTKQLNATCILGPQRTPIQDVEFAVDQLVEIALRALSPGINDPFTAIHCVDRLGAALCRLASREMPSSYHYYVDNKLRVIADSATFAGVADAAFNQIRQYGRSSAAVTIRLLETITVIAACTQRNEDRAALRRHALMIKRGSEMALPEESDRKDVEERYQAVLHTLAASADDQQRTVTTGQAIQVDCS